MATSCGSPCYAAPELVVQEGKYVGTAVDVWSCGVILYAMLAGYLPYDDDPANPEGDNINLLYKYIINTPLTFPEWISAEPRNLLLAMLVPDPKDRCTIDDVKNHSWLSGGGKYESLFAKTVDELENEAQESELNKRRMLEAQRQWLLMQQMQQQQQQQAMAQAQMGMGGRIKLGNGHEMARSQSNNAEATAARHRSAVVPSSQNQYHHLHHQPQPQHYPSPSVPQHQYRSPTINESSHFPASVPEEQSSRPLPPTPAVELSAPSPTSAKMIPSFSAPPNPPSAPIPTSSVVEDHVMSEVDTVPTAIGAGEKKRQQEELPPLATTTNNNGRSRRTSARGSSSPAQSATVSDSERRKKSHRATVQVEYDGGDSAAKKGKSRAKDSIGVKEEDVFMTGIEGEGEGEREVLVASEFSFFFLYVFHAEQTEANRVVFPQHQSRLTSLPSRLQFPLIKPTRLRQ